MGKAKELKVFARAAACRTSACGWLEAAARQTHVAAARPGRPVCQGIGSIVLIVSAATMTSRV
ncbi:MAG TPA: hypothetical protein DEA50_10810 [Parvularcula sp.]|nr:hypothetical protein [Parvularcula sp.]